MISMKKMIVIGAGAAGMMTAIKASDHYEVTIIEKNEKPGKKLYITGKGRCNVTNASDEETFLKNVVTNPKFLYSAIYSYNSDMVQSDFEEWGVKLKTERGNRVFPESDHSSDIIRALTDQLKKRNVKVLYNTSVKEIVTEVYTDEEKGLLSRVKGVKISSKGEKITGLKNVKSKSAQNILEADVVVLTSGGKSYPLTGSTGDGYKMLEKLGIDIVPARPALVPLVTKEKYVKDMMGLSLTNVAVKYTASKEDFPALKKDKKLYEGFGEMLFTHFGVSGPLVLSASSYISSFVYKEMGLRSGDSFRIKMSIDLKPALSITDLDKRVQRDFDEFHNRDFQNSLGKLFPRLLIPVIVKLSGIRPDKKVNEITVNERQRLVNLIKDFHFEVVGTRGFDEAIVTGGGVSVKEISPQNMELKKIQGLRVAGELIDVDALTGGFNLQIAWATAFMAAE